MVLAGEEGTNGGAPNSPSNFKRSSQTLPEKMRQPVLLGAAGRKRAGWLEWSEGKGS